MKKLHPLEMNLHRFTISQPDNPDFVDGYFEGYENAKVDVIMEIVGLKPHGDSGDPGRPSRSSDLGEQVGK